MSSRRIFIKQTGLAAAGALLIPSFAFKPSKKIGIQLYSLREQLPKDVHGVIEKIGKIGYNEAEPFGYSLKDKFWGLDPKAFKTLLADNGLTSPSGHYEMSKFIGGGDKDELKINIDAASVLGSEYIIVPHLDDKLHKNIDDYKKIAQRLNEAAELCRASGLKIGYHNHNTEFIKYGDTSGYEILLKETDPKLVQFEMDIYWVVRSEIDPVKLITENPGRFSMWHIKDMDKVDNHINTEVGNGKIDFKNLYKYAKLAGLKHSIMEQENYSIDPFESIKRSYNYMNEELV